MSAQHSYHLDTHTYGLADDCPRCAAHAREPFVGLDTENLRNLLVRTLRNRFGHRDLESDAQPSPYGEYAAPRSENEAVAMAQVMTRLEQTGALFAVAPDLVSVYITDRWRVEL